MMECKIAFNVPLGYRIVEKVETTDLWEAEKILMSRKREKYMQAIRKGTKVELIGDFLICPICNSHFAANSNSRMFRNRPYLHVNRNNVIWERNYNSDKIVGIKKKVSNWSDRQISFFEENDESNLYISSPIEKEGLFICPVCHTKSSYSEQIRKVNIIRRKNKIIVECEIVEMFRTSDLPAYETITFDCSKGRVSAQFINGEENTCCVRDITNHPEIIENAVIYKVISSNKLVNRTIKRCFSEVWGGKIPYNGSIISIDNFIKMTRFVGYNKEFYDYIPYKLKSYCIDDSFKKMAKKLQNAKNIVDIYNNSTLPAVKSVRKICFEKVGVLFYLNELEKMFDIVKDLNIFCSILKSKYILEILSELHIRPQLIEYFKDFMFVKGTTGLVRGTTEYWYEMRYNAMDYISMSESMKKEFRDIWKKRKCFSVMDTVNETVHSIPMMRPLDKINDCTINGYKFFWLSNKNDYIQAGDKLKNCLGSWNPGNWPVVCIKKQEKYVAAIEISDKGIRQALGINNGEIKDDLPLFKTFEKWRKEHKLEWESAICEI